MKESELKQLQKIYSDLGQSIPEFCKTWKVLSKKSTYSFTNNQIEIFMEKIKREKGKEFGDSDVIDHTSLARRELLNNTCADGNISDGKRIFLGTVPSVSDILTSICKSFGSAYRIHTSNYSNILNQNKKISILCAREVKRSLGKTSKVNPVLKSKRIHKELSIFLKKSIKNKVEKMKNEEKKAILNKKRLEEIDDENRQRRKFNYLLNQTESFASYFLNRKGNNEDLEGMKEGIEAARKQLEIAKEFDKSQGHQSNSDIGHGTSISRDIYVHREVPQPTILKASLRDYQLKGVNWLISLYNQGINGILADDMGLGKTIQSIAFLGYLYESHDIDGPFIIVTPASTLHNWVNEFEKFIPEFKVASYWGSVLERKELRKEFKSANVIVTSYQIAIGDENILKKMKFQYMILDEAQAIKSNSSLRWKSLLNFKTRNRLLLTGTPIQNTMTELWALLHFIMPTLFDNLNEFSEWFSRENYIDEQQISKLHTILKPFMLRRHKDDIKDEIGTKEIVIVECELSSRQLLLYDEIIQSKMDYENIVMHLKKVCNHPDLFEKLEPICSMGFTVEGDSGIVSYRSKEKLIVGREVIEDDLFCNVKERNQIIENIVNFEMAPKAKTRFNQDNLHRSFVYGYKCHGDLADKNNWILNEMEGSSRFRRNTLKRFVFLHEKVIDFKLSNTLENYGSDSLMTTFSVSKNHSSISYMEKHTCIPPLNTFINDSGKLIAVDKLLKKLKMDNHRVLIYFQMTRMMDLFEEFLVEREYTYLRLDGSSKVNQRKELVEEWQNNEGIFVFILSTRAGGVGINLTAADTVVFYDSDWNPTVDQQAMDRVHRLGQKKDVTVYKLITKNTIEERVMETANKKDEMQKIVIKGRVFEGI